MTAHPFSPRPDTAASHPVSSETAAKGPGSGRSTSNAQRPPLRRAFSVFRRLASIEVPLQYCSRNCLTLMTLVALALGLLSARARWIESTVAEIQDRGGTVIFDTYRTDPFASDGMRRTVSQGLGHLWGPRPVAVLFPGDARVTDHDMRLVGRLSSVEAVMLDTEWDSAMPRGKQVTRPAVTDSGLAYLSRLPRLRQLSMRGTAVTPEALAEFQLLRPACCVQDSGRLQLAMFKRR